MTKKEKKEDKKSKHIFVATPMYGGQCTGFYLQSVIGLQRAMGDNGNHTTFSFMFNESLIQRARNALAHQFLKSDATHLFFIDADIRFHPAQVQPMIDADLDIICGIYPKKEINWQSVEQAQKSGVPVEQWKNFTGSFVVNLVNYEGTVTVPINEPIEIWNGGTGFMLIKREALEKLAPLIPSYTNDVLDLSGNLGPEKIVEYFACSIEEGTNRLLSEDYHFCMIARKHGLKVHAAPWVQLAHVGNYIFEGGLIPSP